MELEIDGRLHNLYLGGAVDTKFVEREAEKVKNGGEEFLRFEFALTKSEGKKIRRALKNRNICISTCSRAIADLMNGCVGTKFPVIASLLPTGVAWQLWKTQHNADSRVSKVEVIGDEGITRKFNAHLANGYSAEFFRCISMFLLIVL